MTDYFRDENHKLTDVVSATINRIELHSYSSLDIIHLQDFFAYSNWQNLSAANKEKCCQALSNIYADSFGIPRVALTGVQMNDTEYGGYSKITNSIELNDSLFNSGYINNGEGIADTSNWDLYDTVVHETRHAYQEWAISHPDEFYQNAEDKSSALQQLHDWTINNGIYYREGDNYLIQHLEKDAWTYAHEETVHAFEGIQERNGSEQENQDIYGNMYVINNPDEATRRAEMFDPDYLMNLDREMELACDNKGINYDYSYLTEKGYSEDSRIQNKTELDELLEHTVDDGIPYMPEREPDPFQEEHEEDYESGLFQDEKTSEISDIPYSANLETEHSYSMQENDVFNSVSEEHPKVLQRDPEELNQIKSNILNDYLSVKEDDYRDKGYSDSEIPTLLERDRMAFEQEFANDAGYTTNDIPEAYNTGEKLYVENNTQNNQGNPVGLNNDTDNTIYTGLYKDSENHQKEPAGEKLYVNRAEDGTVEKTSAHELYNNTEAQSSSKEYNSANDNEEKQEVSQSL